MKRSILPLLALALCLSACGSPEEAPPSGRAAEPDAAPVSTESLDHSHQLFPGDNILPHEEVGYCGNTVTTISPVGSPEENAVSFWMDDSVALTDLLLYLDYKEEPCDCPVEYEVRTEFGSGYSLDLTHGYARHDGQQVSLTAEQVELIQGIIERQMG